MKKKIFALVLVVAVAVFLSRSVKVIDAGTEGQYTGVVAFDAKASSGGDWERIVEEITANAGDAAAAADLGTGKALRLKGTAREYISKANGKKNSLTVVPDGYTGPLTFTVQLGSIYTGTAVRDAQSVKSFGDFTNQTEWSQYAKALNSQLHELVVAPLALDAAVEGKTVTIIGAATASGNEVTITPVAIAVE